MAESKEFILFIPGMGVKEPEEYLEKLMAGIRNYCDGKGLPLRSLDDSETEGTGRRRIEVTLSNGQSKTIDIQEAYWGDLRPLLSSESVMRKIIRGFSLLFFWTTSVKMWKQVGHSKYMMFNLIFTLLLILTWYYGALAAAFSAVGANTEVFGLKLDAGVADSFKEIGETMGSWYVWGAAAVVMGVLPATEVIDISYATKCYLQNRGGMFHKVCGRLGKALALAGRASPDYNRITVLAHSFGAVVSTEVLANYTNQNAPNARTITLGGPLLLLGARSVRVQAALEKVLANKKVESWLDFYSENDWLCARSPVAEEADKFESRPITTTVPFDEKASGASHSLYFADWDVMEALLH